MVKKYVLGVLLAGSVLGNLLLLYGSIDQAVTVDHCSSEVARRGSQLEAARMLFRPILKGQSSAALLTAARDQKLQVLPKGEDEIYIAQIKFTVADDKVADFSFE